MKNLTRDEMKKVMGGDGSCQAYVDGINFVNLSMAEAKDTVAGGGHWCCSSCDTASWAILT
jgi:hypothetical protein